MGTEYYHTLIEKGGKVLGYGNVITENDWQILGNENNRAICPPEEKWIGYKTIPFPHPTFVRMPPNASLSGSDKSAAFGRSAAGDSWAADARGGNDAK